MEFDDFKEFLDFLNHNKKDNENSIVNLLYFIDWCNNNNHEELLVRLSSEKQSGLGYNSVIDFTTKRIIITRNKLINRIFELGFVAGLGPFPYMILSKKKQQSKIKDSAKLKIEKILQDENLEFTISYIDVQKIVIKRGSNSVVRNMFGSFITKNYLTIFTKANNKYEYVLSIKKNGEFNKMFYWMKSIIPVEISLID
ncbi:MAG: hypothetical protein O7C59_08595 [Rickettsia endosymbiont of Ixodes persulcatus]|nr:hypothetical protein [Rickettsia endosymbiont of Ixodes persulcatus]